VAIGVAIPVAVMFGLLGIFFFYRHRKQQGSTGKSTSRVKWNKPELKGTRKEPPELGGNMREPPGELVEEITPLHISNAANSNAANDTLTNQNTMAPTRQAARGILAGCHMPY
jgi:hypothetical protein